MQTYFKIFKFNCVIGNILWLFYLCYVSDKTRNKTKEKQEITCLNNFFAVSFKFSFCSPPFSINFVVIVLEKLYAKVSLLYLSYEIFLCLLLVREMRRKISRIPSKLLCIRQVSEFLHVVIPLCDSPFFSDNPSYMAMLK